MRTRHEDKKKNQVTTTVEKDDDIDSTATETTAAFTSVCESEWDEYISIRRTSRNNYIEQSGLCFWKEKIGKA